MKALSIRQPWAHLIATGRKTIEIRSWSTDYRGPLLICSSLYKPYDTELEAFDLWMKDLRLGSAIARVDLVDVRPGERGDERRACCDVYGSDFAWVLDNARRINPFPVKGRLRLFDVEGPDKQDRREMRKAAGR